VLSSTLDDHKTEHGLQQIIRIGANGTDNAASYAVALLVVPSGAALLV